MIVSRTGLSPVMVGRDAELGQLLRLLSVRSGGSVALIGGEPGIGKTRLVSELIGALPPQTRVLTGQADPGGLADPYHLLFELAGVPAPEVISDPDASPHARLQAGLDVLREATGAGTTVLVIDDLHLADAETMAVIERLVEAPVDRLLVVGTYRPEALTRSHPIADLVQRLERRHTVVHLRLERLAPGDVAGFLAAVFGRPPSHRTAGKLHQRTGGNPFFLEELLKASRETDPDRICDEPLPWTLAEALRSQLDDLAPDHRRIVDAAAVLSARVSFDLLAAVTGTPEAELIGILRDLVRSGLLMEAEEDQFAFRHALTREVISGEMLGRERRRLHEAALEVLLTAKSLDLAAIAVHARGAGRYLDMVAAARTGSAQRLRAGSTYAALKLAELGLEEDPDDPELLSTAANAAWFAGYHEDAERYAHAWLSSARDATVRSAALRLLVRLAWESGDLKTMDARTADVEAVVAELPDGDERTRAYAALAQSSMLRYHPADAVAWADRAAEAATRLDLPEVRITALVEKASALANDEKTREEGRTLLRSVADEAERAGAYLAAARALHNLFWHSEPADLGPILERMRADAERAGYGGLAVASYHQGRSWLATVRGDLDDAIGALEDIRRIDQGWPPNPRTDGAAEALMALYLERGDLDRAERILPDLPSESLHWGIGSALKFQLACWRGELARARQLCREAAEELAADVVPPAYVLHDMVTAGIAGGLSAAELEATLLVDGQLRPTGHKDGEDDQDRRALRVVISAHLAEAAGRFAEALDGYRYAVETDDKDMPGFRKATAHAGAARCLVALSRTDEARPHVATAVALLEHWPGWRRGELDRLARRLGAPATAGVEAAAEQLTPREREVAALLAEGLSNAELAKRLVISRKTAAVHVSNILAKLGMTSRAQIATWTRSSATRSPNTPSAREG